MNLPTQEVYDFVWILNSSWHFNIYQESFWRVHRFIGLFHFCRQLRWGRDFRLLLLHRPLKVFYLRRTLPLDSLLDPHPFIIAEDYTFLHLWWLLRRRTGSLRLLSHTANLIASILALTHDVFWVLLRGLHIVARRKFIFFWVSMLPLFEQGLSLLPTGGDPWPWCLECPLH